MIRQVKIGEICNLTKGIIGIQAATPGNFPLVTTADFRSSHNSFQFDTEAVCIPLISATGHGHASLKRIHYQSGKFALGNILVACTAKDPKKINMKYLYIY